jgi:hypothetical protein
MPGLFLNEDVARTITTGTALVAGSDVTLTETMLAESAPFQGMRKMFRVGIEVMLEVTAPAAAGTVVKLTWNGTAIQATLPALPIGCHRVDFRGQCAINTGVIRFAVYTSAMNGAVVTSGGAATYTVNQNPTRPVVVNLGAGGTGTGHLLAFQGS